MQLFVSLNIKMAIFHCKVGEAAVAAAVYSWHQTPPLLFELLHVSVSIITTAFD